eukprot:3345813-Amphidinium_carterae.1
MNRMSSSSAWLDVLSESRLVTSRPVNFTFLWTVIWHNYFTLVAAGHPDIETVWNCAPVDLVHAGQVGDALCDYREGLHKLNSGEVIYLELDTDSVVALAPVLRILLTPGNPLRCCLRADGPVNDPTSVGTGLLPANATGGSHRLASSKFGK